MRRYIISNIYANCHPVNYSALPVLQIVEKNLLECLHSELFSKPQYSLCLRNPIWRAASNICTGTMVPDCMSSKKMIFYLTNFHLICHPAGNTIHFVSTSIEGLKYVIVSTFFIFEKWPYWCLKQQNAHAYFLNTHIRTTE